MSDVFTRVKRSQVMSCIRGKGNKETEVALMLTFKKNKIAGWKRNQTLYGKPDFVFRKSRIAVFVDGCFWHGCEKHFKLPKSNRSFWKKKINSNIKRDVEVNRFLRGKGWKVIRLWEHDVKKPGKVLSRIKRNLLKP